MNRLQEWWFNLIHNHVYIDCARCEILIRVDECGLYECPNCGWLGSWHVLTRKGAKAIQARHNSNLKLTEGRI